MSLSLVIVGGGPRGSGLLERILANVPEVLGSRPLSVHVVEPHTMGAGRIWRRDQSPHLWANSQAEDMTMFTDASCAIEGPVRPGPTFLEWARAHGAALEADLEAERADVHGMSFPSRRLLTAYLTWTFERTLRSSPRTVTVRLHHDRAVDLTSDGGHDGDGRQVVHLERGGTLEADAVLLAQGHLPTEPVGGSAELAAAAHRHALTYLAEDLTADADHSCLRPGQDVIVRGAGLAFVDLVVLLTQGRGGTFEAGPDGALTYRPSGAEPVLHVGSRRGVPYRSKITYRLERPIPPLRFLTPAAVDTLLAAPRELSFSEDVWPLLAKDLAHAHYRELIAGHPEAVAAPPALLAALDRWPWASPELVAAVAAAVPDPADRFDPEGLDRPLAGLRFPDAGALQAWMVRHIEADVARRGSPRHSADLAVFTALLAVLEPFGRILASGRLSTLATTREAPWFFSFFSYYASGPPPRRLRELVALLRAGVVRFLGADVDVRVVAAGRGGRAVFVADSSTVPGEVRATALVEARVPRPSVSGTADPLLAALFRRGEVCEEVLVDAAGTGAVPTGRLLVTPDDGRLVDAAGRPHPARHAFGAGTSAATPGAFSRPGTNAAFFRQNDHAARAVLQRLAALSRPFLHMAAGS